MVTEELRRLVTWSERHRRLVARILIAVALSLVVDLAGALLMWRIEIHGFTNALFFATVQILTVSSSLQHPVTHAGRSSTSRSSFGRSSSSPRSPARSPRSS